MKKITLVILLLLFSSIWAPTTQFAQKKSERKISRAVLEDKIRGGWAAQMIGVSYGAPTEFRSNGKIIEGNLNHYQDWGPKRVENAIDQDDLYVDMTFAKVMDDLGLNATTKQYGEAFKNTKYSLWHANAGARRLLNSGLEAPLSGNPKYNIHANDIDFQIEADFIGLMCPGLPRESNKYCDRVGRVMNYGDGLYGGMFVCGMYSAAFFENDPRKIVEAGLACIPKESGYGKIIADTLKWSAENPDDWKKTWQLIYDKWDKNDSCNGGAMTPFNIDARLNGSYIALGLLYGKGDFARTLEVATRSGQDSDCNPASAAGILGVMLGYNAIPDYWKSGIPALADRKFSFTDYSFNSIVTSTIKRTEKVVQSVGGKFTDKEFIIPNQTPIPPKLEQWNMGIPDKLIGADDPSWSWQGDWQNLSGNVEFQSKLNGKKTASTQAEATLKFSGAAVVIVGRHSQQGGRADVFLDGKKTGMIDFYIVERTNDDALWHCYGLESGAHTVRIVMRPDRDPRSNGLEKTIMGAVTYR